MYASVVATKFNKWHAPLVCGKLVHQAITFLQDAEGVQVMGMSLLRRLLVCLWLCIFRMDLLNKHTECFNKVRATIHGGS